MTQDVRDRFAERVRFYVPMSKSSPMASACPQEKAAPHDCGAAFLCNRRSYQVPPNRTPAVIGMKWKSEPVTKTLWKRPSTNTPTPDACTLNPAPALMPNLVSEGDGPMSGLSFKL